MTRIEELQKQMEMLKELLDKEKGKESARAQLSALAKKLGYEVQELFAPEVPAPTVEVKRRGRPAGTAQKEKGEKVVKYRKGTQEWSGRGRRPGWYVEAEAAGENMGQYLVMGSDA